MLDRGKMLHACVGDSGAVEVEVLQCGQGREVLDARIRDLAIGQVQRAQGLDVAEVPREASVRFDLRVLGGARGLRGRAQ